MHSKKGILLFLLCASLFCLTVVFLQSKTKEERFYAEFLGLFDTVTQIVGYASDQETFSETAAQIHDELEEYHKLYDIYNDYEGISNLKTVNDHAGISPVAVDRKIINLLKFSKEIYERTDGKVNVALGGVLSVWHDYRAVGIDDPDQAKLPPMGELEEKARHIDLSQLIIDEKHSSVYLADADMRLDVGAIAKGYAVEQIATQLEIQGMDHILLSVGGNVRAIGRRADNKPWKVDIKNPDTESSVKAVERLNLAGKSLVSSGDYQRYYTVDGIRIHHIIDPDTLMPASYFHAVSIVCKDSGLADALSTAVFTMPYEQGRALIDRMENVEAMWVMEDYSIRYSRGFLKYRTRVD